MQTWKLLYISDYQYVHLLPGTFRLVLEPVRKVLRICK